VREPDVPARQTDERLLADAQKMQAIGRLAAGLAHEINNSAAAILGFSQLLRRDPSLPEDLRQNADLLVEQATRTQHLVGSLLDFVRQRPPERYPTSVRALIDSVVDLHSSDLGPGRIESEVDVPPDLPPVELDRGQLQQVLTNLVQNAIRAIRDGGGSRLRIEAVLEGSPGDDERVRITVIDDGAGVAPEHLDRLFEAFFTTKAADDRAGLGLSVADDIVRSHGGALRHEPSPWGRGATFTFDLPVRAVQDGGGQSRG
jgi:two-component system NtrC family sensor kinase